MAPTENIERDIPADITKLIDSLKAVGGAALRTKCLELAVMLPDLSSPAEAINAAKMFEQYLNPSKEAK